MSHVVNNGIDAEAANQMRMSKYNLGMAEGHTKVWSSIGMNNPQVGAAASKNGTKHQSLFASP